MDKYCYTAIALMMCPIVIAGKFFSLKQFFFVFLFFVATIPASCREEAITGKAVRISDGDTFVLLTGNNIQVKIRLYGVDAPEKSQDFGNVSKEYLGKLLQNKDIVVISKGKDKYGRVIGLVSVGSVNVNEEMLKAGLVWHFKKYDSNPAWTSLEQKARAQRIGLWIQPNAIPPWEFRDQKKKRH
jgi:micrococcal nuclease